MMRSHRAPTFLGTVLLPLLVCAGRQDPVTPPAVRDSAADTIVGTVRAVHYGPNSVEVLTGVGHALRIERVDVATTLSVTIGGRSRPLADLRRGQVLRVGYRLTERGKDATSLDVVPVGGGVR